MCRRWGSIIGLALALMIALPGSALSAPSTDKCASVPDVPVGPLTSAKGACKVAKGGADAVKDTAKGAAAVAKDVADKGPVGAAAGAAGDEIMKGVTAWVANAAAWFVKEIVEAIDKTTNPQLDSGWFLDHYKRMASLAALLAVPMIVAVVLQALVRQDWTLLMRSVLMYMPLAFLLTGMALLVTQQLLVATDEMSAWMTQSIGRDGRDFVVDAGGFFAKMGAKSGSAATPLFAIFIAAFVTVVGALVVWLELLLREASIYVVVAFLPVFFVAMIWASGGRIARRGVEILLALILSKFVLVTIFALAAAGLGQSRADEAFAGALAGAALLLLAAFSPWVLFRLVPLAEHGMRAASGQRAALAGAASSALPGSAGAASAMRGQMTKQWGAGGAGKGAGAAGAAGGSGAMAAAAPVAAGAVAIGAGQQAVDAVRNRADTQTSGAAGSGAGGGGDRGSGGGDSGGADNSPPRPPGGGSPGAAPPSSPGGGSPEPGPAPPSPRSFPRGAPPPPPAGGARASASAPPAGPGASSPPSPRGPVRPPGPRPSTGPPRPPRGLERGWLADARA